MEYRDQLIRELTEVGISGRLRARIVAEFADHLACDPEAQLGEPAAIARQFADELGTSRARRAAFASFTALMLAGILFAVAFVAAPGPMFAASAPSWFARAARWVAAGAPQFAFAAGLLAVLRAMRLRRFRVIPADESRLIVRRATLGVAFGVMTMASLLVLSTEWRHDQPGRLVTELCGAAGIVALLATLPALMAASRLPSLAEGTVGDLYDDIGPWTPRWFRVSPWRLAWVLAAVIFLGLAVTGFMADDGPDGVVRGFLDGALCLIGFGTVGRYLGLWSPGGSVDATR